MTFKKYLTDINDAIDAGVIYGELDESKNVGIIYHFTTKKSIKKLLNPLPDWNAELFEFISHNGVISTTRNFMAADNIINNGTDLDLCTYNIRIALDGTGISNKYKIRPLAGLKNNDTDVFNQDKNDNRVLRNSGEAEEAIYSKKVKSFKLLPYILDIQIYNCNSRDEELYEEIKQMLMDKNVDIPVSLVRKYKPLKEEVYDGVTHFDIF